MEKGNLTQKGLEREAWAKENRCVAQWLSRVGEGTAKDYLTVLHNFYRWLQVNGSVYAAKTLDELLDIQDRASGRERYRQLELVQRFVDSSKASARWKALQYSAIRSFYLHNRVELPKDIAYRIIGDYVAIPSGMSVKDFRALLGASNRLYRAVFLTMFQGGLGEGELVAFSGRWEEIEPQLRNRAEIVKVSFGGRKLNRNRKPFYSLIGRDAINCLREYLQKERGMIGKGEAIFLNDQGNPLTVANIERAFLSYAKKVGLVKTQSRKCPDCGGELKVLSYGHGMGRRLKCLSCGAKRHYTKEFFLPVNTRYQAHPHEIRDLFRSEWHKSGADPLTAEFFMGHVERIDPNGYNKFYSDLEYVKAQYMVAVPYLNLLSEEPRTVPRAEMKDLVEKASRLAKEYQELRTRMEKIAESRRESDDIMNRLIGDSAFLEAMRDALKRLKT